jgi:phosphoribosylaminoimidazole-succinocarboxamide synthase
VQVSGAALALFEFGQAQAAQRGLLLVDTKYEFGKDADGTIRLIDEVRTAQELVVRSAAFAG